MIETKDVGMHGTGETPLNGKLEFEPGLSHWLASPTDRKKGREKSLRVMIVGKRSDPVSPLRRLDERRD